MITMSKMTSVETDREKLYMGLVSLDDLELVEKAFDFAASGEVPRADIFWPLYYASMNPQSNVVAWRWVKKNFDKLWDLMGSTLQILNLLEYVIPKCAVDDETDAQEFLSSEGRMKKGGMSFRSDLELLHVYSELRKRLVAR
jgi:hypothetical protein